MRRPSDRASRDVVSEAEAMVLSVCVLLMYAAVCVAGETRGFGEQVRACGLLKAHRLAGKSGSSRPKIFPFLVFGFGLLWISGYHEDSC